MTNNLPTEAVQLRAVRDEDLPIFYAQQRDPVAVFMADFPARELEPFMVHWHKILKDERNLIRTILADGQVAGNIVSFEMEEKREVGYWLGQAFWGRGIATRALAAFLALETTRPLYAHIVQDNLGSRRVLEKCGFVVCGEDREFSNLRGMEVAVTLLKLEAQ